MLRDWTKRRAFRARINRDDECDTSLISTVLLLAMTVMIVSGVILWALPEIQRRTMDIQYRAGLAQFEVIDSNLKEIARETAGVGEVTGSGRTAYVNVPSGSIFVENTTTTWVVAATHRSIGNRDIGVEYDSEDNTLTILNCTEAGASVNTTMNITYSHIGDEDSYSNIQSPYQRPDNTWVSSFRSYNSSAGNTTSPMSTYNVDGGVGAGPYASPEGGTNYLARTVYNSQAGRNRWEVVFSPQESLANTHIMLYTVYGSYNNARHSWERIDFSSTGDTLLADIWIIGSKSLKYEIQSTMGTFFIKESNMALVSNYPSLSAYVLTAPPYFNTTTDAVLYFASMEHTGVAGGGGGSYTITSYAKSVQSLQAASVQSLRVQVYGEDSAAWQTYLTSGLDFENEMTQAKYPKTVDNVKLIYYTFMIDIKV